MSSQANMIITSNVRARIAGGYIVLVLLLCPGGALRAPVSLFAAAAMAGTTGRWNRPPAALPNAKLPDVPLLGNGYFGTWGVVGASSLQHVSSTLHNWIKPRSNPLSMLIHGNPRRSNYCNIFFLPSLFKVRSPILPFPPPETIAESRKHHASITAIQHGHSCNATAIQSNPYQSFGQ